MSEGQWQLLNRPRASPRRRDRKSIPVGQAHIKSTFNNTIISITDPSSSHVLGAIGGDVGIKGPVSPLRTPLAWRPSPRPARPPEHGVKKVDVFVKGPGFRS